MWYKLKRILIYPDGVTEKQVYPKTIPQDWLLWYRPLQSDLKDASWNQKDWSWYSWTWNFSTTWGYIWARVTKDSNPWDTTQHIITTLNYTGYEKSMFWWICFNSKGSTWSGLMTDSAATTDGKDYFSIIWLRPADSNNIYVTCNWDISWTNKLWSQQKVWNSPTIWTWYFWCATFASDGTTKFYVNWTLSSTVTSSIWSSPSTPAVFRIWCSEYRSTNKFWGTDWWIRHCWVYNRVINDSEVLSIYNLTQ